MRTGKAEDDRRLTAALWYKELLETNNEKFIPLFFDEHRFLVLKGGGSSGKSIFAGRKVLERVTTEPGHRWLVCRKVDKTLRESCFEQLKHQAYTYYPDEIEKIPQGKSSDMYIKLKNGSEILFSGLDNVEKLKSIYDITGIWIEEASELEEADFNQLDIRLRTNFPYYLQMILTFNPISITHWLKKRFWDRKDPRARTHESTYKDNRFLTPEAIATLESFKDVDEYYYMVYALNQWGVTGKTVFNARAVSDRLQAVKPPISQGLFEYDYDGKKITNIRWAEDRSGPVKIYRAPGPGRPYVIGGDTAGEGSDWFVGQVLDNITGEQAAVLRHQMDEDVYARQIYCLGVHYNEALLGIESNFSTYPNKELQRLGYRKLFVREVEDDYSGKVRQAFGVRTDSLTRPVIIGGLVQAMRDGIHTINDETTLLEMLTFVRNEKLRPEAEPGAHDDTILALAIAHYIRLQQRVTVALRREAPAARRKWSKTMWEDYENATPEEREMMIKLWGRPER